ncbi:MAG: hypothetical protein WC307_07250 [Candidatus Nanoarchaeia archaeon]|jgi:hypothetical protein
MNTDELRARHIIEAVLEEVDIMGDGKEDCYADISETNKAKLTEYIVRFLKSKDGICPSCFAVINDEDYLGHSESRGDYGQSEFITDGFKCSHCGNKEEF